MNIQDITSFCSIICGSFSIFIAILALIVSFINARASEKKIFVEMKKWEEERKRSLKNTRFEFLRDIVNGYTSHNWRFVQYWDFPGVFPPLTDMQEAIPDKDDVNRELFGLRVVTLEHLNILLRVFAHRDILLDQDIEGYAQWVHNWYEGSKQALRIIFSTGDTYPLDFIVWLREVIFKSEPEKLNCLIGEVLSGRLRVYEQKNRDQ